MRKITDTQSNNGVWAADNAGISTALDRKGVMTEIRATVEVTPSATLGTADAGLDGLWRVIQNLRVEGGAGTYFTLPPGDTCPGGILLHYLNQRDGFGLGHSDGVIVAPSRTYTPISFVLHAGARPKDMYGRPNPHDLTAFIPASIEGQLNAVWVTSGNDVMEDTVTITSAVMRFTLSQVLGSEAEIRAEMAAQGVILPPGEGAMKPAWTAEDFIHAATGSDYSIDRNLPTGGYMKRVMLVAINDTATRGVRAGDEVTGMAIKLGKDNTTLYRAFADQMMLELPGGSNLTATISTTPAEFGNHVPKGVLGIDIRGRLNEAQDPWTKDYGLRMKGLSAGDVVLGLTLTTYTANDHSGILYERYAGIPLGDPII